MLFPNKRNVTAPNFHVSYSKITTPLIPTLRKAHKLRIPRNSIRPNIILLKPTLHIKPPCLVKSHAPPLHNSLNLALRRIVEALTRITGFDVGREVESGGRETCFDIVAEGGRETCVDGLWDGQVMQPVVAGEVGGWATVRLLR